MADGAVANENRRTLRLTVGWATAGGAIYTVLAGTGSGFSNLIQGAVTGALVSLPLSWFDIIFLYTPLGERLRQQSFATNTLVKLVFYTSVIVLALIATQAVFDGRTPTQAVEDPHFIGHLTFALVATAFVNFLLAVRRLLGRRVLWNFIRGHYHRPREEQRAFLFIDLEGSTAIAESLGHVRFLELLSRFIFDVSGAVLQHHGDVYKYVGDEVIVTWPLRAAMEDANCVRCYFEIFHRLARKRLAYIEAFGFLPKFRAALHCGTVVAGEIGDFKQEIVYLGDVINTTARLEEACKELGQPFLVSGAVVNQIQMPWNLEAQPLGPAQLRGKHEPLELFTIVRRV